jgi:hypothetical protein
MNLNDSVFPHYELYTRNKRALNIGENRERNEHRKNANRRDQG